MRSDFCKLEKDTAALQKIGYYQAKDKNIRMQKTFTMIFKNGEWMSFFFSGNVVLFQGKNEGRKKTMRKCTSRKFQHIHAL